MQVAQKSVFFTTYSNSHNANSIKEINPLSARIFTVFGHSLLEDRVLHKEAWVAKLLGTHLSIYKKVQFSCRDNSTLVLKGLIKVKREN